MKKILFILIAGIVVQAAACSNMMSKSNPQAKYNQACINKQPDIYKAQGISNAETETRDAQCQAAQLAVPG